MDLDVLEGFVEAPNSQNGEDWAEDLKMITETSNLVLEQNIVLLDIVDIQRQKAVLGVWSAAA